MIKILDPNRDRRSKEYYGMLMANVVKGVADNISARTTNTIRKCKGFMAENKKLLQSYEEIRKKADEMEKERQLSKKEGKTVGIQTKIVEDEIKMDKKDTGTQTKLRSVKEDIGTQTQSEDKIRWR